MKEKLLALALCGAALGVVSSPAITFGPFGPKGEGGRKNGQTFTIGSGSTVFELDGFLKIGGLDLNGSQFGVSAQLSRDALPAGVVYSFTNSLSSDQADLILTYTFANTTSTVFSNLHFFVLLDAEIDEEINTFFNEYGTTNGVPGLHGYEASEWQIDEPGFGTGTLLKNLFMGALSASNAVPANASNDVAQSLGFSLGNLNPGAASTVLVRISEQGLALGSFSLAQHDHVPASTTVGTMSGVIAATPSQIADPTHELLVLTGQVFRDANTNGPPAPTSNGVSGVTVSLLSNSVPVRTDLTDSAGRYHFSVPPGLQAGTYAVQADAAGLTFLPVPPTQKAYFATSNPSTVTLPMPVPILNFDVRGAVVQQFGNVSGILQFSFQSWALNHATGSLLGTLRITNPASSGASFGPPWQLGMTSSPNFYYPHPSGTLPDGVAYVDVAAAVNAQVSGGVLNPGQWVTLTNGAVEVYSLYRTAPTNTLFELWATQQ